MYGNNSSMALYASSGNCFPKRGVYRYGIIMPMMFFSPLQKGRHKKGVAQMTGSDDYVRMTEVSLGRNTKIDISNNKRQKLY